MLREVSGPGCSILVGKIHSTDPSGILLRCEAEGTFASRPYHRYGLEILQLNHRNPWRSPRSAVEGIGGRFPEPLAIFEQLYCCPHQFTEDREVRKGSNSISFAPFVSFCSTKNHRETALPQLRHDRDAELLFVEVKHVCGGSRNGRPAGAHGNRNNLTGFSVFALPIAPPE